MFQSKRNIISIILKQRQQWFVINVIIRRVFRMNKHCERWTFKIIDEMDSTFSALTIREKLIEKHGTKYTVSSTSIGQFLRRHCDVIGKKKDRFIYKKRERNEN